MVTVPDSDGGDPGRAQLAVNVDDARAAELVVQFALAGKPAQQAVETAVELLCGAAEAVFSDKRNGENIGFDLLRSDRLHFDSHRGAMLADAPRSLRPAWGYTFSVSAPIEGVWLAARLSDTCALRAFGAVAAAPRWKC